MTTRLNLPDPHLRSVLAVVETRRRIAAGIDRNPEEYCGCGRKKPTPRYERCNACSKRVSRRKKR